MKRLAIALALVATVAACKKAQQPPATSADTSHMMMGDTSKMAGDTSKHMMAPDTTKHE